MKLLSRSPLVAGFLAAQLCAEGLNLGPPVPVPAGQKPTSMAIGDVNGDGVLDVVVAAHFASGSAATLLGDGLGGFATPISFAAGTGAIAVALADVSGDGVLDLATASEDGTSLLTGDASGAFASALLFPGKTVTDVTLRDVNFDGNPDVIACLAKAGQSLARVRYMQGLANLSFAEYPVGPAPARVVAGDSDGDGSDDLVVAESGSASVSVMNLPTGPMFLGTPVGDQPVGISVGDLNADGRPDIVTANAASQDVSILLGDVFGYAAAESYPAGERPVDVALADLDGDGTMAVIVASSDVAGENHVFHLPTGRDGGLMAGDCIETGGSGDARIAAADFDGDDRLDIAATLPDQDSVAILLNEALWWNHGGASSTTPTPPVLVGAGALEPDTLASLNLTGAPSAAPVFLVEGAARVFQPFKGGTLVPEPQVIITGFNTDDSGALQLAGRWPDGIPLGLQVTFQMWVVTPRGFSVSDGVSAEQP